MTAILFSEDSAASYFTMRPPIVMSLLDGFLAVLRSIYLSMATDNLQFERTQDLTGQVTRTEFHYFAYDGNADIWKGQWLQNHPGSVTEVAVKVLKGPDDPEKRIRILREMSVWSSVHHPNIAPFLGVSFDFDRPRTPCLVSPYYRHGNIMAYIKKQPNVNKLALLTQTSSALSYLHGLLIIHGDVKGSNILIDDNGEVRLTDFGLSRILQTSGFTTKTASGTLRYMAPELVEICEESAEEEEEEESAPRVTVGTDVWAFGMTVTEVFTESMPFSHIISDASVIHHVVLGGRPKREHCLQINEEIWTALESCWDVEPTRRPSMAALSILFHAADRCNPHPAVTDDVEYPMV